MSYIDPEPFEPDANEHPSRDELASSSVESDPTSPVKPIGESHWVDIVTHLNETNARNGTDKVSSNMIAKRRQRARLREAREETGEHLPLTADSQQSAYLAHVRDIEMQHRTLDDSALARIEAEMNGETPLDAPATKADTEGLHRFLKRHLLATEPTSRDR